MGRNGQPLAIFSQFRQGLALFVGKFKFHVLPRMTLRIRYRTLKTSRAVLGLAPAARGRRSSLLQFSPPILKHFSAIKTKLGTEP
jgi:hypothetical protein